MASLPSSYLHDHVATTICMRGTIADPLAYTTCDECGATWLVPISSVVVNSLDEEEGGAQ